MRVPIVVAGMMLLATVLPAQGKSKKFEFCKEDVAYDSANHGIDYAHPRYFVEVIEVAPRGHQRAILTSRPHDRHPRQRMVCERVNAQVSHNGKIVVRINREFLREKGFEGNFSITGRVEGRATSRAIEIPGYSVIGKEAQIAPVRVASASTIEGMMNELQRSWPAVERRLAVIEARIDSSELAQVVRGERMAARERAVVERVSRQRLLEARVDSLRSRLASAMTAADSATASAGIDQFTRSWSATGSEADSLRRLLTADSLAQRRTTRTEFVREALDMLNRSRPLLLVLEEFSKPENLALVRAAARAQHLLPSVVVSLAKSADSVWKRLPTARITPATTADALAEYDQLIASLRASMHDLTGIGENLGNGNGNGELDVRRILLSAVKDAEINVKATGAEIGDVIVLTFTDSVGVPLSNRVAEVRMVVRDFGLGQRVKDAVLFMNLARESNEQAQIDAATARAKTSNAASSVELPLATRGSPTAGVSFGWVYSPRRDDEYSPLPYALRVASAWMEPGFGFNAGAGSVPMKRLTFSPEKPAVEEAVDSRLAYTLGGHVSIFGGALVWSGGWTLNGVRARSYTALGISFLSATDKAKELFKGLNP